MEALPKFHETFIPILTVLKDGTERHTKSIQEEVRNQFYGHLSKEVLFQKLASGGNTLVNRIHWGMTYLKMATYLHRTKKGHYQISAKGRSALASGSLSLVELKEQAEFIAHQEKVAEKKKHLDGQKSLGAKTSVNLAEVSAELSPNEMLELGQRNLKALVTEELLEKLKEMDPYEFESVILDLLKRMGYGFVEGTKKSNDGGVDGVVYQDQLGLETIYVQAKRFHEQKVRETHIRHFIGAMSGDTNKGIFVTTSDFDAKAVTKAQSAHHKIVLVDGEQLADLLYEYGVGVQVRHTLVIKSIDEDFFGIN